MQYKKDLRTLKSLFFYVKPYKFLFFGVFLLSILLSVFEVGGTYLFKVVIDQYIMQKDYQGLFNMSLLIFAFLISEVVSTVSFLYYTSFLGQMIVRDLREYLFENMMSFKMKYYDNSSVGILVTRAVNDIERIGEVFSSGLFEIFSDLMKMVVVIAVMLYTDWKLSLIVFITLPISLYLTNWFQSSMKNAFTRVRTEVANINSFVQERIVGMRIVQLFTAEQQEYKKFKSINKKHRDAWLDTNWLNSIFFPLVDLVTSFSIAIIVWYGSIATIDKTMQLGTIFMFIQLTQKLYRPLRQVADKFNTLQMGIIACQRVFEIIDSRQENLQEDGFDEIQSVKGEIEFKNVSFGYNPGQEILRSISFKVEKGQKVAIVGATGAGKSTIISLMTRFYDVNSGKILIDGKDISELKLKSLRKHIGVVLQDVFLFADTILENITLSDEKITQKEVEQAAKSIGIHEFLEKLPNGYKYNVKERGTMLSVGQRQLISFLRAYISKPEILILDEATASVDSVSEKLIEKATENITKDRTSIIIAHRLSTIQNADKIIVLDKGEIVEEGTHSSLLEIENGYYKNLYDSAYKH